MHNLLAYLVEFVGTFVFLGVIMMSGGKAIPIGIALAATILLGGAVSGGNFNPAVSVMMHLHGKLPLHTMIGYIVAQLLGAVAALKYYQASH